MASDLPPNSLERSPLLGASTDSDTGRPAVSRRTVAIICLALFLVVEFAATVLAISLSQVEEAVICRQFYPDVDDVAADPRCKDHDVQSELSTIQGWAFTFGIIPGIVTAIPYGIAADKYGRRAILSLSLLGTFLAELVGVTICRFPEIFPIRLVWLATLLLMIGGGPFVFNAIIFTIASDVSTAAQRSVVFFYVAAIAITGKLISGPLAYMAIEYDPWFAIDIGLFFLFTSVLVALACPETHPGKMAQPEDSNNRSDNVDNNNDQDEAIGVQGNDDGSIASSNSLKDVPLWRRIAIVLELDQIPILFRYFFVENKRLGLLLVSLIFTTFGNYASILLLQYTTKRFGWTWAQAGLLSSVTAFVNLVLLAVVLPVVSQLLITRFSPVVKDALLARAGMVVLLTGTFGIGFSNTSPLLITSLMIQSLGYGYDSSLRSLLVVLAGENNIAMLFTAMSVVQNIGLLVAGPLLAWVFRVGLRWGGAWTGLPYFATGCLLSCAACIIFGVRLVNVPTSSPRHS
ncbi:major facilitator superfamily domain-containing protein [Xylariales sp. PMI_506]|nr:major facilitator superfamily domain-containing protein [Xylariales sp. PMI_506]